MPTITLESITKAVEAFEKYLKNKKYNSHMRNVAATCWGLSYYNCSVCSKAAHALGEVTAEIHYALAQNACVPP